MRQRILSITLFVWEAGVGLGLQQGLFDEVPKAVVAVALVLPPLIFFSTRETMRRYTKRRPRMSLLLYLIGFLLAGYLAWFITFKTRPKRAQDSGGQNDKAISEQLTEQGKRIDNLTEAFTRNPSVEADARLSILKGDHDRLSEKREELTKQEKETLDKQALTLQSLEEGKKRHLAAEEIKRQQRELTAQREKIEMEERTKQRQKDVDAIEIEFAKNYAPITNHVVTVLHKMLREISKESAQTFSTDFPTDRPSIYDSNMFRDGKLVDGQQIISVGSSKDWAFRIRVAGALRVGVDDYRDRRELWLEIRAGLASVLITSPTKVPPDPRKTGPPPELSLQLWVDPREGHRRISGMEKPLSQQTAPFADYQKPIEAMLRELIQNRYIAAPLERKH